MKKTAIIIRNNSLRFSATGLAIGLTGEIVSKIFVEILLYVRQMFNIFRSMINFVLMF